MNKTEQSQKLHDLGLQAADFYLYDVAIKYLTEAAELGNADAMYLLGSIYDGAKNGYGCHLQKESERLKFVDDEQIFKWYKRAADKGCKKAFIELALIYLDEDNLEYNKRAATKWLKMAINWNQPAAEKGDPYAMLAIANAYAQYNFNRTLRYGGVPVPGEDSLSKKWFNFTFATFKRRAVEGDSEAMIELGMMLYFGSGTTRNVGESIRWLKKAAESGDDEIKIRAYRKLADIIKYNDEAVSYSKKAAELGDFISMRQLWYIYKTDKNLCEAERWLKKSEEIQAAFLETLPKDARE